MSETKGRQMEAVVDHLKCGEPVWRGSRFVCPKHPRVAMAKIREASDPNAKPKPQPKPVAPGMPSDAFLDALLGPLKDRLDAIDMKLQGISEVLKVPAGESSKGKAATKK